MAEELSQMVTPSENNVNGTIQIYCLDNSDDIINFLKDICEDNGLTRSSQEELEKIFEMIKYPFTVVCEQEYVDRPDRKSVV